MTDSGFDFGDWIDEALRDDAPLAYGTSLKPTESGSDEESVLNEPKDAGPMATAPEPVATSERNAKANGETRSDQIEVAASEELSVVRQTEDPDQLAETKIVNAQLLKAAAEDCIAAASYEDDWSPDTIKQVRTCYRDVRLCLRGKCQDRRHHRR